MNFTVKTEGVDFGKAVILGLISTLMGEKEKSEHELRTDI